MATFRIQYFIFCEGKQIGSGANTVHTPDENNDHRDKLKNDVMSALKKKYPSKSFAITIHSSQPTTHEAVKDLPNGWTTEMDD